MWPLFILFIGTISVSYGQHKIHQDSISRHTLQVDGVEKEEVQIYKLTEVKEIVDTWSTGIPPEDSINVTDRVEVGFNVSPLLQKVISPGTSFNFAGQEVITANFKLSDQVYFRNGFNALKQRIETDEEDAFTSTFSQLFFRTGIEWRHQLSSRFELHLGIDGIIDRHVSKFDRNSEVNNSTTDRKSSGVGVGIPVGLTFWINDRIGIWTESSLRGVRSKATEVSTFDNNELTNTEQINTSFSVRLPISLFVKMTF